jgi:perosamine synthetase
MSQLRKLSDWVERRQEIAARYDEAFAALEPVEPVVRRDDATCAYHLYVIRLALDQLQADRETVFEALQAEGVGVNVHYIPVHLQPYYRNNFGTELGFCPKTEAAYERILTLPVFPRMTESDVDDVIEAVQKVIPAYQH